jgi:hypothetical protein
MLGDTPWDILAPLRSVTELQTFSVDASLGDEPDLWPLTFVKLDSLKLVPNNAHLLPPPADSVDYDYFHRMSVFAALTRLRHFAMTQGDNFYPPPLPSSLVDLDLSRNGYSALWIDVAFTPNLEHIDYRFNADLDDVSSAIGLEHLQTLAIGGTDYCDDLAADLAVLAQQGVAVTGCP